jgi:steroid 5-alpha reductase family enzyme
MWWAFYIFSIAATGDVLNWTIWGTIFLSLLFVPPGASVDVTESLSSQKYPAYREYQAKVSRFVPWFPSTKAD